VDVVVEHVDTDQRQIGGRLARFLDQAHDPTFPVQLGHTIVLWMLHRREDDLAVPLALGELFDEV